MSLRYRCQQHSGKAARCYQRCISTHQLGHALPCCSVQLVHIDEVLICLEHRLHYVRWHPTPSERCDMLVGTEVGTYAQQPRVDVVL